MIQASFRLTKVYNGSYSESENDALGPTSLAKTVGRPIGLATHLVKIPYGSCL